MGIEKKALKEYTDFAGDSSIPFEGWFLCRSTCANRPGGFLFRIDDSLIVPVYVFFGYKLMTIRV